MVKILYHQHYCYLILKMNSSLFLFDTLNIKCSLSMMNTHIGMLCHRTLTSLLSMSATSSLFCIKSSVDAYTQYTHNYMYFFFCKHPHLFFFSLNLKSAGLVFLVIIIVLFIICNVPIFVQCCYRILLLLRWFTVYCFIVVTFNMLLFSISIAIIASLTAMYYGSFPQSKMFVQFLY